MKENFRRGNKTRLAADWFLAIFWIFTMIWIFNMIDRAYDGSRINKESPFGT